MSKTTKMQTAKFLATALFAVPAAAQTLTVTSIPLSGGSVTGPMTAGDLNGDGVPDLAVAGTTQIAVIYGTGAGGFAAPTPLPTSLIIFAGQPTIVDSDADGRADLWVRHTFAITRYLNSGGGVLTPTAVGPGTNAFALADFDEDGLVDFVFGTSAGVSFVRNDGAGGYAQPVDAAAFVSLALTDMAVSDFDRDGHLDLLTRAFGGNAQVMFGDGTGHFVLGQSLPANLGSNSSILADVNGDRAIDIVLGGATTAGATAAVALNDGAGNFAAAQPVAGMYGSSLAATDLDGDGIVDLVGAGPLGLLLAMGTGGGAFAPTTVVATGPVIGLATSDVDGDGRPDVVTMTSDGASLYVLHVAPAPSVGLAAYGTGTAACAGTIGIAGSRTPQLGASDFRVLCTNTPPSAPGLLLIGTKVANGWDPLGLGVTLHLGFALPLGTMASDVGGSAGVTVPLPGLPFLAGLTVNVQSFWLGDPRFGNTCSPALYELASSRGLSITLQP